MEQEGTRAGFTSTTKDVLTVRPKEPSSGERVKLSILDQVSLMIPVPLVSYYDKRIDTQVSPFPL